MDSPIWVCVDANNQWHIDDEITTNPKQSGFPRAMRVAQGRTVTFLDEKGIVFTTIWRAFELFFTLIHEQEEEAIERTMERRILTPTESTMKKENPLG